MKGLRGQQHKDAMAKDHQKALGKHSPQSDEKKLKKEEPDKWELKKEFNRSR
jgi:hypothetical protein